MINHSQSREILRHQYPNASEEELNEYEELISRGSCLLWLRDAYAHLSEEEFLDLAEREFPHHLFPIPLPPKEVKREEEIHKVNAA